MHLRGHNFMITKLRANTALWQDVFTVRIINQWNMWLDKAWSNLYPGFSNYPFTVLLPATYFLSYHFSFTCSLKFTVLVVFLHLKLELVLTYCYVFPIIYNLDQWNVNTFLLLKCTAETHNFKALATKLSALNGSQSNIFRPLKYRCHNLSTYSSFTSSQSKVNELLAGHCQCI